MYVEHTGLNMFAAQLIGQQPSAIVVIGNVSTNHGSNMVEVRYFANTLSLNMPNHASPCVVTARGLLNRGPPNGGCLAAWPLLLVAAV